MTSRARERGFLTVERPETAQEVSFEFDLLIHNRLSVIVLPELLKEASPLVFS